MAAPRERTSPVLIVLAVLTGLPALGAVGYLLSNGGLGPVAVATATPTIAPTPTPTEEVTPSVPDVFGGTGVITFGEGYDPDTLGITGQATIFKVSTTSIAYSASFTESAGATSLTIIIASRSAAGVEKTIIKQDADVSDPSADTFANKLDLSLLVGRKSGTYVMRYLRDSTVLAEGTFTLTK